MKTTKCALLAAAALAGLLAACQTPASRIKDSPAAFARLNPDQQALVKQGRIEPGFDMEAVRLALGDPDRVVVRTDAQGQRQIWHYVTYEDYQGAVILGGYYHRYWGWGGPYFYAGAPYYSGYPARVHDRFRVEFGANGLVASVEEERP